MLRSAAVLLILSLPWGDGALAADGKALFNGTCAACHQRGGAGSPGLAPPLADLPLWKRLGASAATYLRGVMLTGMSGSIEVDGQTYAGLIMPPQEQMSNEELAAIGNYVLGTLNGLPSPGLTEASIAEIRAAPPTHATLREIRKTGGTYVESQ
jgi:mono/diheme cytochrome c family protein